MGVPQPPDSAETPMATKTHKRYLSILNLRLTLIGMSSQDTLSGAANNMAKELRHLAD
jgi:hypothetical protein